MPNSMSLLLKNRKNRPALGVPTPDTHISPIWFRVLRYALQLLPALSHDVKKKIVKKCCRYSNGD